MACRSPTKARAAPRISPSPRRSRRSWENEKGLLIDFKIVGSQVGANAGTDSLTVDLGTIAPGATETADWALLSTLQGKFKDFSATFTHEDDKGDLRTSLIDSVNIHELIRLVHVTTPSDDGIADFLVNDIPDANHTPDTLYLSTGGQAAVSTATAVSVANAGALTETLQATQSAGWSYLTVADPAPNLKLISVTRSDGKVIPIDGMVWRTNRSFPADAPEAIDENLLHLLDSTAPAATRWCSPATTTLRRWCSPSPAWAPAC